MIRAHTGFTFLQFPKARSRTARIFARQWQWLFCFWIYSLAAPLQAAPALTYEVIARYPHRTHAFTQGLELAGDTLYESSGLYEKSYVARWQPENDSAITRVDIPARYFAEGLTRFGDKLYLLTWQSGVGLVLNAHTLQREGTFRYSGEGWGLTHNQRALIMSDGSARLRFLDPVTLRQTSTLDVILNGAALQQLNELEWIDAGALAPQPRLLANIWQTDHIVVIDPASGRVTATLDLTALNPRAQRTTDEDVLNGIAYDRRDQTLLVTGKRWRYLWRIRLHSALP